MKNSENNAGSGGAISNMGGTLTLNQDTFTNNLANRGGALYNSSGGQLILNNVKVENNTSPQGAGIYNDGGFVAINNSTIQSNNLAFTPGCPSFDPGCSSFSGGGIYNNSTTPEPGTVKITDSSISFNQVEVTGFSWPNSAYGIGIYNNGSLSLYQSSVSDNAFSPSLPIPIIVDGVDGGGIYSTRDPNLPSPSMPLSIIASSIIGNTLSLYGPGLGAGVYLDNPSNAAYPPGPSYIQASYVAENGFTGLPSPLNCFDPQMNLISLGYNASDSSDCFVPVAHDTVNLPVNFTSSPSTDLLPAPTYNTPGIATIPASLPTILGHNLCQGVDELGNPAPPTGLSLCSPGAIQLPSPSLLSFPVTPFQVGVPGTFALKVANLPSSTFSLASPAPKGVTVSPDGILSVDTLVPLKRATFYIAATDFMGRVVFTITINAVPVSVTLHSSAKLEENLTSILNVNLTPNVANDQLLPSGKVVIRDANKNLLCRIKITKGTGACNLTPSTSYIFITYTGSPGFSPTRIEQPVQPPLLTQGSLLSGTVGSEVTPLSLNLTGGYPPYSYITPVTLPPGLTFDSSTGILSGTPTQAGIYNFSIGATDQMPAKIEIPLTVKIEKYTPTISLQTNPTFAISNTPLTLSAKVSGYNPVGQIVFATPFGALCTATLANSTATCNTTTPSTSTAITATYSGDSNNASQTGQFTLSSIPQLQQQNQSLPLATIGSNYNFSLAAIGGFAPYRWSVVSGNLPPGLALSSSGVISGTPVATGTSIFTIKLQDSGTQIPQSVLINYNIVVNTLPAIPSTPVPTPITPTPTPTATPPVSTVAPSSTIPQLAITPTHTSKPVSKSIPKPKAPKKPAHRSFFDFYLLMILCIIFSLVVIFMN